MIYEKTEGYDQRRDPFPDFLPFLLPLSGLAPFF